MTANTDKDYNQMGKATLDETNVINVRTSVLFHKHDEKHNSSLFNMAERNMPEALLQ